MIYITYRGIHSARRSGFTLVELLVSLALIVFIMSILSVAFSEASGLFRSMKSSGDMAEKLRASMVLIRRDVSAYHFDGNRLLSAPDPQNFWVVDNGPPLAGYFRVWHGSQSTAEGQDLDGITVTRSTNHMLSFTVRLLGGNQRSDYFSAFAPSNSPLLSPANYSLLGWPETRYQDTANTFNGQTAEVAYFLRQQPDTANGTPLFTLFRRQWLTIPPNTNGNGPLALNASTSNPVVPWPIPFQTNGQSQDANGNAYYLEMSCKQDPANPKNLYFNSLPDLAIPPRRYGMNLPSSLPPDVTKDSSLAGIPSINDPVNNNPSYPLLVQDAPSTPPNNFTDPGGTSWPNAFPGGDALLTDVVSFEVRLLVNNGTKFETLFDLTDPKRVDSTGNNVFFTNCNPAFGNNTNPALVFDTWYGQKSADGTYDYTSTGPGTGWQPPANNAMGNFNTIPIYLDNTGKPIRILAVQITLRIWDLKTQQTRQATLVQDL